MAAMDTDYEDYPEEQEDGAADEQYLQPIDADEAALYLSAEGPLARNNPAFEERPTQIGLLMHICEAFNNGHIGVFEAGTGVGKSFAYLIPALLWHLKNKERIVISTGTINLQQQLMEKDIPAAKEIIGRDVKTLLIKGRQQYVCLRRLQGAAEEKDLFSEDAEELERIASWAAATRDGSRSDLSFMPTSAVWSRVNSESDACMGMRCPRREQCFVMRLRKDAADAGILVVNHHLLFADVDSRLSGLGFEDTAVLPPYSRLVFDEAHGIEDAATSFFSGRLSRFRVTKQLNLLYHARNGRNYGYLNALQNLSKAEDELGSVISLAEHITAVLEALETAGMRLFEDNSAYRLVPENELYFGDIFGLFVQLRDALIVYTGGLQKILDAIDEEDRDIPAVWESRQVYRRLSDAALFCKTFLEWKEHPESVFWLEKNAFTRRESKDPVWYPVFIQTPLDIAPKMNAGVFAPVKTVVCTSATLRTGKSFSYWLTRSGASFADPDRVVCAEFASPFPYRSNVLLAIPDDAPFPSDEGFQAYTEEAVCKLIEAAAGRTLALFTSHSALRQTWEAAEVFLRGSGYTLLRQGDDDRARLLHLFKQDRSSVLFATDSFWEGIDVPGDSLSQVIMVKLPFSVPSDPVFAARCEALEKQGRSSFMELSVPGAVIKFRQGFGRLLRHSTDRGVVVALDRRLTDKQYGRIFLDSIPETRLLSGSIKTIASKVADFLV
jgi:ATP-dependent DNA helicase DinG